MATPGVETPFAFRSGSVRTCAETRKPAPEIASSFVYAPGWNCRRLAEGSTREHAGGDAATQSQILLPPTRPLSVKAVHSWREATLLPTTAAVLSAKWSVGKTGEELRPSGLGFFFLYIVIY